jgi:4-hydroxy-3-polyprenylbenzoate decarboxylase
MSARTFVVCFTGGSGIAYGLGLVEALLGTGAQVHLAATNAALRVLRYEAGIHIDFAEPDLASLFSAELRSHLVVHPLDAVEAAPSSGSAGIEAAVLCPCSMGSLARIAHGFSSNLVERTADVALKEGRPLILVPRETPLSRIHLANMLKLAEAGAIILPAMPGFYHRPQTAADLVDFMVAKILDRLNVEHELIRRWRTPPSEATSTWDEGEAF